MLKYKTYKNCGLSRQWGGEILRVIQVYLYIYIYIYTRIYVCTYINICMIVCM